jgi:hypothetical protein
MNLIISVCATKSYTYAMLTQAKRVAAAVVYAGIAGGDIIIVGDESEEISKVCSFWTNIFPENWKIHLIKNKNFIEGGENYKQRAQLLIADMRTVAHSLAVKLKAGYLWSLDSDTLPAPNALRVMFDALNFDNGYYSVAMCPYPNTSFLGGRGTIHHQIAEDFLPEERDLPVWLKAVYERVNKMEPSEKVMIRKKRILEKIKKYPPLGNVFALNGKKWRKRGWLESAYPGIGKGSIVPTDWVGFGCTLMNARALQLAYFDGYEGHGTEDLYIGWNRWYPNGIKMAVLPHCPADHVIWEKKKGGDVGKYTLYNTYHETEGEFEGHLRIRTTNWVPEVL